MPARRHFALAPPKRGNFELHCGGFVLRPRSKQLYCGITRYIILSDFVHFSATPMD
jgi:hypothetical protein